MRPVAVLPAALALVLATAPTADAAQPETWHSRQARVTAAAQAAGRQGAGVTVAVVDTWVDRAHPSFGGRVLPGVDCVGGCSGAVPRDNCEHGTHVAGTVGSAEYGVAPGVRILPLRILKWDGKQCTGNTDDAAAAVRYAVSHGARVVNLSVGGESALIGSTTALPAAVKEAADAGVLVVFAAGNDDSNVSDAYGDDAVVVAATGPGGGLAAYSRRGSFVDVAAPGGEPHDGTNCRSDGSDCIASTYPDGEFAATAGTSMAAPHVAGLAALLFAQNPARTADQVVARIKSTARPVAGAGAGLVDFAAALGATATARPRPPATAPAKPRPTATRRPVTTTSRTTARPPAPPAPRPTATRAPAVPTPAGTPSPAAPTPTPRPVTLSAPESALPDTRRLPATVAAALVAVVIGGHASRRRRYE